MEQSTAQRRLVKSPPELWAELSSEDALARRLASFGEIHITRVEPETTVAWEGDRASGTVQLAPSGWGTQVTLTATPAADPADPSPPAEPVTPPTSEQPRRGFLARLLRRPEPAAPLPAGTAPPLPPPAPALDGEDTSAILGAVLDDLGAAHHRPFSRD